MLQRLLDCSNSGRIYINAFYSRRSIQESDSH
ncbi:MAG TPA: hypothetical protein DEB17_08435 [Chlorobaculum sp.]|uniref:Uncharacterized protein n=1 Tax=Chlorobaculum tepidum (strain ATCC 49652 / DSM 12025 / NBRC 103806 / TLS) TaxID=194439 RepID=Q8KF13_CHLTE|nr:hypothetical protein CT0519 [Chlorobaculum tepidum TLS]HBU23999.1 hypothetical protein [Chlorobaculum sp.]